jgi:alpha-glucuronidase
VQPYLVRLCAALVLGILLTVPARATASLAPPDAEDGYALWLRYRELPAPARDHLQRHAASIVLLQTETPTLRAAREELQRGLKGMLGRAPALASSPRAGSVVLARAAALPAAAAAAQ